MKNKTKAVYTDKQMREMMEVTRSWTLNNPSGPLPFLPVQWCDYISEEANLKANKETMPKHKQPHWIIDLLMKIKLL